MWLYVSGGFVSVVAHRTEHEHLLVRARHPDHIGLLPGRPIIHTVPWHKSNLNHLLAQPRL